MCTHTHTCQECVSSTLQHTATHCNTLQPTATHTLAQWDTCQTRLMTKSHSTHCNTLQHTATHCNTLQHTLLPNETHVKQDWWQSHTQPTATHCNTLQHTLLPNETHLSYRRTFRRILTKISMHLFVGLFSYVLVLCYWSLLKCVRTYLE